MKGIFKIKAVRVIAAIAAAAFLAACLPDAGDPELAGRVSILGNPKVDQTLTARILTLNGNGDISYQWKRGGTNVGTGIAYIVKNADINYTITVTVSIAGYTGGVTSPPTGTIEPAGTNDLKGTVSITGTPKVGQTLTADISKLVIGNEEVTYEWKYYNTDTVIGTGINYTVRHEDVGYSITVTARGTGYTSEATSPPTGTIEPADAALYTVTFDSNGGSTVGDILNVPHGTTVTLPPNPSKGDYVLNSWNTRADGSGSVFDNTTAVTGNITVYAQWSLIEMKWVAAGNFTMGQNGDGASGNQPNMHTVNLTGFYMGKYEVTQGQWEAVMGYDDRLAQVNSGTDYGRGANYPMYWVSWYAALVFCNKLSISEGLTPAYRINGSTNPDDWGSVPTSWDAAWDAAIIVTGSNGYRLPTEAQWEYAAKGGAGSPGSYIYAGSNTVGDVAWYVDNSGDTSRAAGGKAPNGLGLYDMTGNVFEWCWDWLGDYTAEPKNDPLGASSGSNRVLRGGGWHLSASGTRSADRSNNTPYFGQVNLGLRLARP